MKAKILIEVRGGTVVAIHTNQDSDIVIIDYDNISDDKSLLSEITSPDNIAENFHELFNHSTDKKMIEIRDQLKSIHF